MRDIERIIGKKFEKGTIPTGKQICEKQLYNLIDRIEKVKVNEEEIASYLPITLKRLSWLSTEDLVKRVVSLEFNRLIDYYADAAELDIPEENTPREKKEGERSHNRNRKTAPGFSRLRINLGKADGFYPNTLIDMINRNIPGRIAIGKIDILPDFSRFEIEENEAHRVIAMLKNLDFFGKRIQVGTDFTAGRQDNPDKEKQQFHRKKKEYESVKPRRKGHTFDERKGKNNNYSGKKAHKNK